MTPSVRLAKSALLGITAALLIALPAAAATYSVDGTHSSAIFRIKHFGSSNFYGVFREVSGTIHYDPAKPDASSIEVTIKAESVDTRNQRRDGHAKSPDFLNAAQFPNITFKSTSVKPLGDDRFEVTGALTLLGVTKTITATAEKVGEGKSPQSDTQLVGFEARFVVDRTDFGMGFMAGPMLGKEVTLIISLEAGSH